MATHIPTPTTSKHKSFVKELKDRLKTLNFFIKIHAENGGHFMRLDERYEMNEYHGKVDDEIFSHVNENGEIVEIHLDRDYNINQVYQVI